MRSRYDIPAPFSSRPSLRSPLTQANYNRLLDVARETYKENVGDVFQLHRSLCDQHDLPMQVIYQGNGFSFSLKKADLDASQARAAHRKRMSGSTRAWEKLLRMVV